MIGKWRTYTACLAVALGLSACSTVDVAPAPKLGAHDVIAVLPLANYTETPQAGRRAASIAYGILQVQRHGNAIHNIDQPAGDPLFNDITTHSLSKALEWARSTDAKYALTGSVQEWRYKVGVDGEPAVGVSFNLIDLNSGATVWSATGSQSGWSRSSLASVAQDLIRNLLAPLKAHGN